MPSKKKMAKMPAEAPKAAPMGPLFGYVLGTVDFFLVILEGICLAYILRRAPGVYWPSLSLGIW